ncbi:MAG: class II aldolase/adducin family protein, partial [Bacteriovoracaceae bacterium]
MLNHNDIQLELEALSKIVHWMAKEEHIPATGGNFSYRPNEGANFYISRSGIDKENIRPEDFLLVDKFGKVMNGQNLKVSDETPLHGLVYEHFNASCTLHSHHLESLWFSESFDECLVELSGLEMLKIFEGISSHEEKIYLPILENSQDMTLLKKKLEKLFVKKEIFGFVL